MFTDLSDFLSLPEWAGISGIFAVIPVIIALFGGLFIAVRLTLSWRANRRAQRRLAGINLLSLETRNTVLGRDKVIADLHELLTNSGTGAIGPVATGGGGLGKTTVVREYARIHANHYALKWILSAESEPTLIKSLADRAIAQQPSLSGQPDHENALIALRIVQDTSATQPCLVIYDNVEKPDVLARWKADGRHLHLLLTSRFPDWPGAGFKNYPLPTLSEDDAVALLRQEAGLDDPDFPDLARQLGALPLALVQAGEWLRANRRSSAKDYAADITRLRERVNIPGMSSERDRTTAAVVEKTLPLLSPDARAVLDILAWWAPEGISPFPFEELAKIPRVRFLLAPHMRGIPGRVRALCRSDMRLDAAFAELRHRALLEDGFDDTGTLRMHRLFQDIVRAQQGHRKRQAFRAARAASAILVAVYPGDPQNPGVIRAPHDSQKTVNRIWDDCARLTPDALALWAKAAALWRGPWAKPGWAAMDSLLTLSGLYLFSQGNRAEGLAAERAALEMKEARLGDTHRDIPFALGNLALTLMKMGEFSEADTLLTRAVALDKAHRPDTLDMAARYLQRANLEFCRAEAGQAADLNRAEDWIEQARTIREGHFGPESEEVADFWNTLGYLRRSQGQGAEAAGFFGKALTIRRALPEGNADTLASSVLYVGATWLEAGEPAKAEPLLVEAHGIFARIHPTNPQHEDRQSAAGWLISCLYTLARAGDDPEDRRKDAAKLCADYGFDPAEREQDARKYDPTPPDQS